MRIHMEQLRESGLRLEFEVPANRFPSLKEMLSNQECDFTSPIQVRLRAARFKEMVEIEGNVRTSIRLTCGRCLREFLTPLESDFALTYTQDLPGSPETDQPEEKEIGAEEVGLIYFRGEEIDLTEGIQEQVLLALPLRPLCSEKCKGLCANCGTDLNDAECKCSRPQANSPFATLGRLRLGRE